MDKPNNILIVPHESSLRKLMRSKAAGLVAGKGLIPPASIGLISDTAKELIRDNSISADYTNFAMVLIGNEIWRNIYNATPYNRRLILLPQCLRNSKTCQAEIDDLGLICAGCRSCRIDDFLNLAESLGYTSLVAEGTTTALKLVEEGSVDAVLGISCMDTLEKAFDTVVRSAVPVIGVPLLYNGCENTKVDEEWVIDEIKIFTENSSLKPVPVRLLEKKVKGYFNPVNVQSWFPGPGKVDILAREMILRGGHRMRPLLSALSYYSYAPECDEKIMQSICLVVECFHKASLIHDDIEDNSERRYNRITLHKEYGVPVAINAGDFLIGKGYNLISGLEIKDELIKRCYNLVSSSHINITRGQADDIQLDLNNNSLRTENIIEIFKYKSGEAVKVALLLGAIAGDAPPEDMMILETFAYNFGIAYQIQDDIDEYKANEDDTGLNDFPFLWALLNEKSLSDSSSKEQMMLNYLDIIEFRRLADDLDLMSEAAKLLDNHLCKCRSVLENLGNTRLKLSLLASLGKVFR